MPMKYEAILFDLDGVVVDTKLAVAAFWQQIAANHGYEIASENLDQWVYGRPAHETLDGLFPRLSRSQKNAVLQVLQTAEQQEIYQGIPGVVALLRTLHAYRVPMALVTGAQRWKVEAVLAQLCLDEVFTVQVSAEDIGRGKPDPEGYLRAAHLLTYPASSCIVFEDAPAGVQAACAAGALCIGVREDATSFPLLASGARCVIPDFTMVTVRRALSNIEQGSLELSLSVGTELHIPLMEQKVVPTERE